tara:strand:+ start:103 stop:339 length:237 start_codon:yes stop_codon:yes gene_type:complete
VSQLKKFIHDHGTEALKLELERKKTFMNEKSERLKPFKSLEDIQQDDWDFLLNDELKFKNKFLYQKLMLTRFSIFEKS